MVAVEKKKIVYLDPKLIQVPPVRITATWDDETYSEFAQDIAKEGIEQPLLVALSEGSYYVIDGKNRLDQAKLQGIERVPCLVKEMSLKDLQLRNLVSNRLRGKTKASEEVMVIRDLYENHHCGIEEITERTGMRRERVEQLLQIGGVDPEVWEALDQGRIGIGHAYELSRLVDRSAQLKMLRVVEQYKLRVADIKGAVDEAIKIRAEQNKQVSHAPSLEPPKEPSAVCQCCKGEYPVRELSAPILCRYCFAVLITSWDEAMRARMREDEERLMRAESSKVAHSDAGGGI